LNGVVASPQEIVSIRKALGERFLIITPGVRPTWSQENDQKRVMTPGAAIAAGANYIVVGRPVITADRPTTAALRITTELASMRR